MGLKGKRIGWYTSARGQHYKVDTLMQKAVDYIKSQGAEVIESRRNLQQGGGLTLFPGTALGIQRRT